MTEIKNREIYQEEVDKSASEKYTLTETHQKNQNDMFKLFKMCFNKPGKHLKDLKNKIYYTGGYPTENSPSKIYSLLDDLTNTLRYLTYLGKEDLIKKRFSEFGISIRLDNNLFFEQLDLPVDSLSPKKKVKIKELYNSLFSPDDEDEVFNISKKDLMEKLLDGSVDRQKVICAISDSIKLDSAERVEEECEISKSNFMKVVNIKYKDIKDGSASLEIAKIEESVNSMEAALSIFKEK